MVQELLLKVRSKTAYFVLLLSLCALGAQVQAQSLLLPGDVVIVSVNSSDNSFDFIPLIDLEPGTDILFSNGIWNPEVNLLEGDPLLRVVMNNKIEAGTNIHVNSRVDTRIRTEGQLSLNENGDRLFILQEDEGIHRILFGVGWGAPEIVESDNEIGTAIPNSISAEDHTFVTLGNADNYQYYLRNGASGTPGMLAAFISDPSKWRGQDEVPFPPFGTAFRLLKPPVMLFNENVSTSKEGESILLNVAIYEHDGSRLTVPARFLERFSMADTSDLSGFKGYEFNFTGLIGDAVYSIEIRTRDNEHYQGSKNAYFELGAPSKGSLGDFVSHVAFIQDDEVPELTIQPGKQGPSKESEFIEITNKEKTSVSLSGWKLVADDFMYDFGKTEYLSPSGSYKLSHPSNRDDSILTTWPEVGKDIMMLMDPSGQLIAEWIPQKRENIQVSNREMNRTARADETEPARSPVNPASSNTTGVQQPSVQDKTWESGWYAVSDIPKEGVNSFYWDERSGGFAKPDADAGYQSNRTTILYMTEHSEIDSVRTGKILNTDLQPPHPQLTFLFSGSDMDENGFINGKEGYNLVFNDTGDDIPVGHLLRSIEEQLQSEIIYPYLYAFPKGELIWDNVSVLKEGDYIPEGTAFFVRADSIVTATEINYVLPQSPLAVASENLNESDGTIKFELQAEHSSDSLILRFYDDATMIPRNLINPALDGGLTDLPSHGIAMGGKTGGTWNSGINLGTTEKLRYVYPIAFRTNQDVTLTFRAEEIVGVPDGWKVAITDSHTETRYEVSEGWKLELELSADESQKENSATEYKPEERFLLMLLPPGYEEDEITVPDDISLVQNYPNPFNPSTMIAFSLPESMRVKLSVFNVVGQPIVVLADGILSKGDHTYEWDATGLPSGMYIYQLEVGTKVLTRKMTLVK